MQNSAPCWPVSLALAPLRDLLLRSGVLGTIYILEAYMQDSAPCPVSDRTHCAWGMVMGCADRCAPPHLTRDQYRNLREWHGREHERAMGNAASTQHP